MTTKKTTGILMLQEKRPQRLIGTMNAGVNHGGPPCVSIRFVPTAGMFSVTDNTLAIRSDLATDLLGYLHILLASVPWLDAHQNALATEEGVKTMEVAWCGASIGDAVLHCRFDELDVIAPTSEADGPCTLRFSVATARSLAERLAEVLGQRAAWVDQDQV